MMAFFDNRHWLLSHIRNSFISSDGTGMCEAVIADDIPKNSDLFSEIEMYPRAEESEEEEEEVYNSFDNHSDWDLGGHRLRGSAPQKSEKSDHEKKKSVKVKHIKWEDKPVEMTDEERKQLFQRKEIKKDRKIGRSLLAQEIEKCSLLPKNPFSEFAKFDGSCQTGVPTRTYKIFLTVLPRPERDYPIQVCVLSLAKVSELIGFICWKYMMQNPNSPFKFRENIDEYGLYIAEDDGEVDWDFSSLDPRETVGKFGLAYLALVELSDRNIPKEAKTEKQFTPPEEVPDQVAKTVDSEAAEQFRVDLSAMESLLHQTFRVNMLYKMRSKVEVILAISGDKMEVHPVVPPHAKPGGKMWKQKAVVHDIRVVVFCEILELKSSGRAIFRIVNYSEQSDSVPVSGQCNYKNNDFETDQEMAEEIVRKLNNILDVKCGIHRKEYLALKHKKNGKRNNFNIWPL
ncbi:UNVERIFIED_CONTAM: hypothetical protein PYX00_009511 [Menopon gallinae]|uniref:Stress-activated map kinase-interacting protein 1 n=1 Tax=Menopon gallinae TaxID=328185 RepID=A0AAW2HC32_9NEOP